MNGKFSAFIASFFAVHLTTEALTPCQVTKSSDSQEIPNNTFPIFADTFEVRILVGLPELNILADMVEYHDSREVNKSIISIVSAGLTSRFIYDSEHLLMNSIHMSQGNCWNESEEKLNSSFGHIPLPGWDIVLSPYHLIPTGPTPPSEIVYLQADTIRGISVDKWQICLKDDTNNLTYVVDYYISQSAITTPNRVGPTPSIVRMTTNTQNNRVVYDVIDFIPFIEDKTIFQTLSICESKEECFEKDISPHIASNEKKGAEDSIKEKPLPPSSPYFGITTELAVNDSQKIFSWKEFYLYNSKLVLYEYAGSYNITFFNLTIPKPFDKDPIKEIHDFNTGYAYYLDDFTGQCSLTIIPTSFNDVEIADDMGHVELKNLSGLFLLSNSNIKWTYAGKSVRRDISCDYWEGSQVLNTTNSEGVPTVTNNSYIWHFSDDDWVTDINQANVPIMLEIYYNNSFGSTSNLKYNIFYFNHEVLSLNDFDVSACYSLSSKFSLALALEGTDLFNKYVKPSPNFFYFSARYSIAQAANVTDIRIDNMFVDEANQELTVWFTLLDKPIFEGDVVNAIEELDLNQAFDKLEETINKGQLSIAYFDGEGDISLPVKSGSLRFDDNPSNPQSATGYSSAEMGGMAFGMLVLGGLFGAIAGFFTRYRRGIGYKIYE